jgi:hypothetical protein
MKMWYQFETGDRHLHLCSYKARSALYVAVCGLLTPHAPIREFEQPPEAGIPVCKSCLRLKGDVEST